MNIRNQIFLFNTQSFIRPILYLACALSVGVGVISATPAWATADAVSGAAKNIPQEAGTITDNQPITDLDRFAIIEKRYFGHGYPSDTIEDRLFRLENLVFGTKTHAPLPDRIKKLESVLGSAVPTATNEALNPGETPQTVAQPAAAAAPIAAAPVKTAARTFNGLYDQAMADVDASRFHAAAEGLEQAIQLNPNSAKAYALLANTLLRLQDREGAKEAFRACFQVDPFGADGRNAKAMLLKMVKR